MGPEPDYIVMGSAWITPVIVLGFVLASLLAVLMIPRK